MIKWKRKNVKMRKCKSLEN